MKTKSGFGAPIYLEVKDNGNLGVLYVGIDFNDLVPRLPNGFKSVNKGNSLALVEVKSGSGWKLAGVYIGYTATRSKMEKLLTDLYRERHFSVLMRREQARIIRANNRDAFDILTMYRPDPVQEAF